MRQNYIRAETLTRSNAILVAAQNRIPLARVWGGGDVASADGLRFVVPVRTIHSGSNPFYYGHKRGITFYNLVSDQFTGLNGITVPGTLRDSLTLLSVVLEQQAKLQPTEITSDTGAHTDTIFGIFHPLGYRFSPRLADSGGARFWRVNGRANYDALDGLASQRINTMLIVQHWQNLLRLAGSLKLGTVQAAGLIRTLQTRDRPTRLARTGASGESGQRHERACRRWHGPDERAAGSGAEARDRRAGAPRCGRAVLRVAGSRAVGDPARRSSR